jgi:hypothetical protein
MRFLSFLLTFLALIIVVLAKTPVAPSKYANYMPPYASTYDSDRNAYTLSKCKTRSGGIKPFCIV